MKTIEVGFGSLHHEMRLKKHDTPKSAFKRFKHLEKVIKGVKLKDVQFIVNAEPSKPHRRLKAGDLLEIFMS